MTELSVEAKLFRDEAIAFAKKNKKPLAREITDRSLYPREDQPISIFMAGSPGAGKTEVSRNLAANLQSANEAQSQTLRIDPDEYRQLIPGYTGSNSWLIQPAVSIIVEKVFDLAIEQNQTFILDGTFSNLEKSISNIDRCLRRGRSVFIFYVYQPPELAWEFVVAREAKEGRNIPFDSFVDQLLQSRENIQHAKHHFGVDVDLTLLVKPFDSDKQLVHSNVEVVDDYLGQDGLTKEKIYQLCKKELA